VLGVVVGTRVVCGVAVCAPAVASGSGVAAVGCVTDASASGESF